jgi:phage baseplate assembly protein W
MAQIFNQDKYTPVKTQTEIYSDLFTDFDVHPELHDVVRKRNEEAVKTSIRNLIFTNKYERPFQPALGGNISKYLFEPISPQTQAGIQNEIRNVIENYEPRAKLIDVVASPYVDDNAYVVTIVFYLINKNEAVTLNTILYRVR